MYSKTVKHLKKYLKNAGIQKGDSRYSTNRAQEIWPHVRTVIDGVESYWKSGNHATPPEAYLSLIRLFCDTQGASNDFFHELVKLNHPPYQLPAKMTGTLGEMNKERLEHIVSKIEEDGFFVFDEKLSDDIVEKLLEIPKKYPAHLRPVEANPKTYDMNKEIQEIYDPNNKKAIRYDWYPDVLRKDETVQGLLADITFMAVAQEYFKSQPVSDVLGYWIHTDFVKEPNSMSATKWHFDMDRIKWLKFFVYLSDMDTDRGPHCYVRGSHKTGGIPPELLKRGYARIEDYEVEQYYKKEDIIEVVGKKGTIIAADTRGLHKGKHLLKDHRVLFQMKFCDSLFGGENTIYKAPEDMCPELKKAIAEYPRVYQKYFA